MAVSGKTAAPYEFPYLAESDIPDMGAGDKAMADKLQALKWLSQSLKPTMGLLNSSETKSLGSSYVDVPGVKLELTPAVASSLAVIIVPALNVGPEASAAATISVDGTDQTLAANLLLTGSSGTATVAQLYLISLTAALHTIKMRAKKEGSGAANIFANSRLFYLLFAS